MLGTKAWPAVRLVVDLAARLGLERRLVLRRLGVSAGDDDGERRVPIDRVFDLWAETARAGDVSVPFQVAQAARLDDLQLMGFAILTAPSGRAALDCAIRYAPLIADSGRWRADADGDRIAVRWVRDGERSLGHRLANEAGVAQFVAGIRELCGAGFSPSRVHFRHAAPASSAAHRAFFRCPVEHGQGEDGFWFHPALLDRVVRAPHRGLARFVHDQAEQRLRLRSASVTSQTRDAIDAALRRGERPCADAAARTLGTSERTLRRRLAEDGVTFSTLVEAIVRDRARSLVTESKRSLTDIAIDLGFSDSSAFSHAFKRWFGHAPRDARALRRAS